MDRSPEARAAHFFQKGLYTEALQAYSLYLNSLPKNCKPEQHITVLFNRSACYLKLKEFDKVVEDCNLILRIDEKHEKALGRKIKAMCSLSQFSEAQSLAHQWIRREPTNHQARKELERLNVIVKALSEQDNEEDIEMGGTVKVSPQHAKDSTLSSLQLFSTDGPTNVWTTGGSPLNKGLRSSAETIKRLWGGFDSTTDSHFRTVTREHWKLGGGTEQGGERSESGNNWGVAINTSWDEDHSSTGGNSRKTSIGSASSSRAVGSESNDPSKMTLGRSVVNGRNSNGEHDSYEMLQTQFLLASESDEYEGDGTVEHDVLVGNGAVDKTVVSNRGTSVWKDPPPRIEKGYTSLWSDPDPFNCRQKGQSPPWEFSDKKQSRFLFANEKNLNCDAYTVPDTTEERKNANKGDVRALGDRFSHVTLVDAFSKSLVSPSTQDSSLRCAVAGGGASVYNGGTTMSSTDKLFLQHMQRNTGGHNNNSSAPQLGKIQGNNYSSQSHHNKAPGHSYGPVGGFMTLQKTASLDRDNVVILDPGDSHTRSKSVEHSSTGIPQAFIPHVVQAHIIMGNKQETSTHLSNKQPFTDTSAGKLKQAKESENLQSLCERDKSEGDKLKPAVGACSSSEGQEPTHRSEEEASRNTEQRKPQADENKTDIGETSTASSTEEKAPPREWKWRPPPRGLTSQEYSKCPRFVTYGLCSFRDNCSQAHSEEELTEWRERFEERKKELIKKKEEAQDGSSYVERLMEKLMKALSQETVMTENMENVNIHANYKLSIHTPSKKYSHNWLFTVTSKMFLKKVILIDDNHRRHFSVSSVTCGSKKAKKTQRTIKLADNCQDWDNDEYKAGKTGLDKVYRIKVSFTTDIFGTFRQSVVFDFGVEPVLVRELCVDSCPVTDLEQLTKDLTISETGRWDVNNMTVVDFAPKLKTHNKAEQLILDTYPVPMASKVAALSESLLDPTLTKDNYRDWMHSLLYIEEIAQFSSIAKFNVTTELQVTRSFMLMPHTVETAKYAQNGELFARMEFSSILSEDTAQGRLVLLNVFTVYLAKSTVEERDKQQPQKVYEAMIEEKGKNFIFLRLSEECVKDLNLKADQVLKAQVQCQLNRMPMCEMHMAVDELPEVEVVFPSTESLATPPWTQEQLRQKTFDQRKLNEKQKEALSAITLESSQRVAPILLIGPYGTGKTYTLAQAAKEILKQEDTRVLICTHSNSAADLYIKDYFHPYVVEGHPEAFPLRIYYRHRWVQTVSSVTLQYCLTRVDPVKGTMFVDATKEDVEKRRIVVATFSTARQLLNLDLPQGFFTHILLDEAAQALECETIMPLVLANEKTRVVLAGDHMQLSPEIHSEFARDRNFQMSIVERLYHYYPQTYICKIMLCENYRSHRAIVDLTSELFYNSHLRARGNQTRHERFAPLTFFTALGEDTQHQNSTGFFNNAEVYEVVDRVVEVTKSWPKSWGTLKESSIGVVSLYADQVIRIRAELRKQKLHGVCVESVFNVQGKQFRVIFLSTVRTRHTCETDAALEEYMDYGFLSNVKLLNTAITRAQSLVAVVGDPVALCSIGKCRKLWERFIELSNNKSSLHGMAWSYLRGQLDGVELKKSYILNPLAPEFVPNRLRHSQYTAPEPIAYGKYGYAFAPSNAGAAAVLPMGGIQNLPWMSAYQRPVAPPQPYVNPAQLLMNPMAMQYLSLLQQSGGLDPQNLAPYVAGLQPPPVARPPSHPHQHHLQQQNSTGKPLPPGAALKQPEEGLGQGQPDKSIEQLGEALTHAADKLAAQMRGQTLHHLPPPPHPPPVLPTQQQQQYLLQQQLQALNQAAKAAAPLPPSEHLSPFLLPPYLNRNRNLQQQQQQMYQQSMMGQRPPWGLPVHPPPPPPGMPRRADSFPPQHFMPLAGPPSMISPGGQGLRTHNAPQPASHSGLKANSLQSPNISQVSPVSSRSDSQSPSRLGRPHTPKVEFLPKAVNVKSPQLNLQENHRGNTSTTPQKQREAGGSWRSQTGVPPQNAMRNPYLQGSRMQREGNMAADTLASKPGSLKNNYPKSQVTETPRYSGESRDDVPQELNPRSHMTSYVGEGPPLPSRQFMVQDLERQWQEESLRGEKGPSANDALLTIAGAEYRRLKGLHREDDRIVYNPHLEATAEKFSMSKRQGPFGEGPQPFSRQKLLAEAQNVSQSVPQRDKEMARGSSYVTKEQDDSLTSPLSVEISSAVMERDLGLIHIDSPVDVVNMSPSSRERKVPLYMRRVQQAAMNDNTMDSQQPPPPPPRLSYAGAVGQVSSRENTPPLSAPLTKGPYTPEVNPFFPHPSSTEQDREALLLLRNLTIKESPAGSRALFQ